MVREPEASIDYLIGSGAYSRDQAKRYYLYRIRRICELAKRTPGSTFLTHANLRDGKGLDLIQRQLNLKIRTWKIEDFDRRWDGWVCAIYADNDIIRLKFMASKIKVADKNDLEFVAPKGYILFPQ